jgi:uncharacterized protein (TIGR03086 family)
MTATETDALEAVLAETEATIAAVGPNQLRQATPCPEFDVAHLVDHLVGWANSFAERLTGVAAEVDPNDYRAGDDPGEEFNQAARTITAAYRDGVEETYTLPAGFLILEFLVHGWDLAVATGRSASFSPAAAELGLDTGRQMLKPEYRGPGKSFGYEVEVTDAAGQVERLVAFMGRDPDWQAPG